MLRLVWCSATTVDAAAMIVLAKQCSTATSFGVTAARLYWRGAVVDTMRPLFTVVGAIRLLLKLYKILESQQVYSF